jgi:hypothetical protein
MCLVMPAMVPKLSSLQVRLSCRMPARAYRRPPRSLLPVHRDAARNPESDDVILSPFAGAACRPNSYYDVI